MGKAGKHGTGKIQFFSEKTRRFYQLVPTITVPALRINAVPMHRFVNADPLGDAKRKVAAASPRGKVLDICTGLGYCAIEAAKSKAVESVATIENDAEVIALCRANEASSRLFTDTKITLIEGDAAEKIRGFADEGFDCVFHDPPTFVAAPGLYGKLFYSEIMRVLKKGGTLWHYAADPGKRSGRSGALAGKIMKGLQEAGFAGMRQDEPSAGIICTKAAASGHKLPTEHIREASCPHGTV